MQNFSTRYLKLPAVLLLTAFTLLAGAARDAGASNVTFGGTVGYSYSGSTAILTADRVQNNDASGNTSGTLKMELWALPAPYSGTAITGYKMAQYTLGTLGGQFQYSNVNSGAVAFVSPPSGTYYVAMILTEFTTQSGVNGGFTPRDYVNFSTPLVIGGGGATVNPPPGIWENPAEIGTGYSFDFKHGVLVVVFYSFNANGSAQWYISSGPVVGNTFVGTLDKFVAGQCISASCGYRFPTAAGNDGAVTIIFSSDTTATMYLPGGRVIPIHPSVF